MLGQFWIYALNSMQTNAQIIRQANARVLQAWGELANEVLKRVEIMREEVTRASELSMRQI